MAKNKKSPLAAVVIEMAKKKDDEPEDMMEDKSEIAKEILEYISEGNPEGFAMALKDFISMCDGSYEEE